MGGENREPARIEGEIQQAGKWRGVGSDGAVRELHVVQHLVLLAAVQLDDLGEHERRGGRHRPARQSGRHRIEWQHDLGRLLQGIAERLHPEPAHQGPIQRQIARQQLLHLCQGQALEFEHRPLRDGLRFDEHLYRPAVAFGFEDAAILVETDLAGVEELAGGGHFHPRAVGVDEHRVDEILLAGPDERREAAVRLAQHRGRLAGVLIHQNHRNLGIRRARRAGGNDHRQPGGGIVAHQLGEHRWRHVDGIGLIDDELRPQRPFRARRGFEGKTQRAFDGKPLAVEDRRADPDLVVGSGTQRVERQQRRLPVG